MEQLSIAPQKNNFADGHLTLASLPQKFKGFLFDMDGTLFDSMTMWRHLMPDYLRTHGIELPREVHKSMQGNSLGKVVEIVAELYHEHLDEREMFEYYDQRLKAAYGEQVAFKPFALEYLQHLRAHGRRLALVTTTDRVYVDVLFERFGLHDYFEVILTISDVGAGKNKPDIYHEAARRLGLGVQECVVFEDALFALETARAAGYVTIGVEDHGHVDEETLEQHCDLMIKSWDWA
ncbi:MAG: HAD-IA family hydrolase [Acidaminobacter sp.]|uniref:HAD family hydrolase n=1 Tax=Acidaminobacter sp. TaxID=1872102 RepID=UPI0013806368|nr:HAD family phosphatase [Acidaminobacter sp.]MZQ98001.1 HAD-IA family hydrolase [Acidaminobacter sp.]